MSPRDPVASFLALTAETQALARACAGLKSGANGPDQTSAVRTLLGQLEVKGLAVYRLGACVPANAWGWRLTDAGRALARTYRAVGKAARKRVA